jgi:methyltransferase (TIGR00027 family)
LDAIQDVTGTAFIVAEYRARENAAAHPLYVDPVVPIFLNERTHAAAERMVTGFPAGVHAVQLRTRYYDDHLDAELRSGVRQVVILGAGLDTRAERKASPGVAYFEIDDAEIVDFKRARLAEAGFHAPAVFITGNYVTDGLIELLAANGFDFRARSYFIWEGNTMYLTRPTVLGVLKDLRRHVTEFAVSFDYVSEDVIAGTTGDPLTSGFARHFAEMGAPWIFGANDIGPLATETGMAVVDQTKMAELFRAFWPDRRMQAAFYDNYALCTLGPAFSNP